MGGPGSPPAVDFDLSELSDFNSRRNSVKRILALAASGAVLAIYGVVSGLALQKGLHHPAELGVVLTVVLVGCITVYLAFDMAFVTFVWLTRPPVRMRISGDRLEFTSRQGHTFFFGPGERELRIGISVASDALGDRPESRIRLLARGGKLEALAVWQARLPFAYLPVEAVPELLAWARRLGFELNETPGPVTFPRKYPDWRFYRLAAPGAE